MISSISRFILKLMGWRIEVSQWPLPKKYIIIVIPHTSAWDFPLGVLARSAMNVDIKFVGKDSLFRPPYGWLFRALGGIPVDRSKRNKFVDAVAEEYKNRDQLAICLAPEGTRKRVDTLKTGFYYIAKSAGIPILLCKFDYPQKLVHIDKPFYPTNDMEADFRYIFDYFRGVRGKIPENSFLFEEGK